MSANTYGRQVVISATNKSGGGLILGDVVVIDTTNNTAFTTDTAGAFTGLVAVAQGTIANNADGLFAIGGWVSLVNVNASVTRGHFGKTYTVAKQATDAGASRTTGTFCQFVTGGTTPAAVLYPVDLAGVALTNPMTTVDDIIVGGSAGAPSRLGKGSDGQVLTVDPSTHHLVWATPSSGFPTYDTAVLTGNVFLLAQNTFYTGPSKVLASGTWWIVGHVVVLTVATITPQITAKLWDGTTIATGPAAAQHTAVGSHNEYEVLEVAGVIASDGVTATKISVASDDPTGNNSVIEATPSANNTGLTNKASGFIAIKVA